MVLCSTNGLTIATAGSKSAAGISGTVELTLSLRNDTAAACHVDGYPIPDLVDASGVSLPTTVVRGASISFTDFAATPVILEPTDSAYFNVAYADVATGSQTCESAAQIEITMPGSANHQSLPLAVQVCDAGTLIVSPVFGATSAQTQTTVPPTP